MCFQLAHTGTIKGSLLLYYCCSIPGNLTLVWSGSDTHCSFGMVEVSVFAEAFINREKQRQPNDIVSRSASRLTAHGRRIMRAHALYAKTAVNIERRTSSARNHDTLS